MRMKIEQFVEWVARMAKEYPNHEIVHSDRLSGYSIPTVYAAKSDDPKSTDFNIIVLGVGLARE